MKPSAGPQAGQTEVLSVAEYCEELARSNRRLEAITGVPALPLFRAPGGKTSPALLKAARSCPTPQGAGYEHVGWADAGFLGDELPSGPYPNELLLKKALQNIRPGDILMAHLGIWSRQDPWAPTVLEPLIVGLKARGFCFDTLRHHPLYREHLAGVP
jgi:peptidoglycan/xylan/chitin deacetylase (PgdA/CDA1 family)